MDLLIVILIVLWLLGAFGRVRLPALSGNLVHIILVIVIVLVLVRFLR